MKKISRLAALFAATALLFGAIGCSDEDEGGSGEDNKSITLNAGDIFATEDNTLYVKILDGNKVDAFMWSEETSDYAPVAQGASYTITDNALSVNAGEAGTFTGTVVSATQMTLTIGKDTMTLKKADKEPTGPNPGDDDPPNGSAATAKTYSFAGGENGIVAADISNWDLSAKDVINAPIATTLTTKELANGASISWKGSKVGTLRFRAAHEANQGAISALAPTITTLNYNGGANSDISSGIAIADLDRYVSIPVDGAGTVTADVTFKGAKESDNPSGGPFQVAFVDADGKLLGDVVTDAVTASSTKTLSGTVTAAGTVYLAFSRNGAKKGTNGSTGGDDVSKITVAPKN